MDNRDIKDILKELYRLNEGIKILKEEIEHTECLAEKITPTLKSDIIQSSNKMTMEDLIVRKDKYIIQLRLKVCRQLELKQMTENLLESLNNSEYSELIRRRYYKNQKWWEIACALNLSEVHVKRLHGTILNKFRDLLKKNCKN